MTKTNPKRVPVLLTYIYLCNCKVTISFADIWLDRMNRMDWMDRLILYLVIISCYMFGCEILLIVVHRCVRLRLKIKQSTTKKKRRTVMVVRFYNLIAIFDPALRMNEYFFFGSLSWSRPMACFRHVKTKIYICFGRILWFDDASSCHSRR
jgi:hypothetical protein